MKSLGLVNETSTIVKSARGAALTAVREAMSGVVVVEVDAREAGLFEGAVRWSAGRRFVLATMELSSARLMSLGPSAPNAAVIAYVRTGECWARIDEAPHRLTTGSAIFLDLREPFELGFEKPVALTMLASHCAALNDRFAAERLWHGFVLDRSSAIVFGAAQEALAGEIGRARAEEAEALAAGLFDLASRAANTKLAEPDATDTLTQVRRFIDRNLGSTKLDTAMIGRAFGISQATLYRLFAPLGGVAAYIRKARLARARRILLSPQVADRRIGEIAHDAGFRSATVFNRAFLSEFGVTPSEARAGSLLWRPNAQSVVSSDEGNLANRLRDLA